MENNKQNKEQLIKMLKDAIEETGVLNARLNDYLYNSLDVEQLYTEYKARIEYISVLKLILEHHDEWVEKMKQHVYNH